MLDWDVLCSPAVLFGPLVGCALCGVSMDTTAAQVCGRIASLPYSALLLAPILGLQALVVASASQRA